MDVQLGILQDRSNVAISVSLSSEDGRELLIQSALSPNGPWTTVTNASQPLTVAVDGDYRYFRAALAIPSGSADAPEILRLVRNFAFSTIPKLNPKSEFDIQVIPVGGLWDALQVQIVKVRLLSDGAQFNEFAAVLRQGKVATLGISIGGHGLMSGLVQNGSLYFTYSWGSGVHRSQVGRLGLANDELRFWDSAGFPNVDLFLSRKADGALGLVTGTFEGFNHWSGAHEFGHIDEANPNAAKIVGLDGTVLGTLEPRGP